MELNTMQFFWQKGGYSPFWILASRGQKNQKEALMRAINSAFWMEHDPENFGILHFITPR